MTEVPTFKRLLNVTTLSVRLFFTFLLELQGSSTVKKRKKVPAYITLKTKQNTKKKIKYGRTL